MLSKMMKPVLGIGLMATMSLGAAADPCSADDLRFTPQQRQQLRRIVRSGGLQNPQVQQQIYGVLTPQQVSQLCNWQNQGQRRSQRVRNNQRWMGNQGNQCANNGRTAYVPMNANNSPFFNVNHGQQQGSWVNGVFYPAVANNPGACPSGNQAYYPVQNNGAWVDQPYYSNQPFYNQGPGMGMTVLSGLLNSGILNGIFNNL